MTDLGTQRPNLVDSYRHSGFTGVQAPEDYEPYDRKKLSYATTFTNPWQSAVIRSMEMFTGKLRLLYLLRKFERGGVKWGQPFWKDALDTMGIPVTTPDAQIDRIPREGPLVVVANHPHGLVDGMVLAEVMGRARTDYKILTRSLLTGVKPIDPFMIPVPFPHEDDALKKNLEMRATAMAHLKDGGAVILFPSGVVASSDTAFGPVIEREWNPFTAKMIQRSGANVLPIFFPGSNSRLYQIANQVSATMRQGLLLHEVRHALNRPQSPVVGHKIPAEVCKTWASNPRGFMARLREITLALRDDPDGYPNLFQPAA
ncbi:MAG: lysophospholipid acyltransferase family protein [Pseudomonadota bacterium]